ncbi:AP-3 complex subunit beta-2 [Ceratocystis platani]|uniref:AP-3 complex subunit beta-2 n=1 Tax=Ceratocystis fimbriata f. sp. platani TaxID=88771 RepID=A0A0F8B3K6_CERFI|nr:AP-3 complex subunit beta-2 [Ceratocystis platani]
MESIARISSLLESARDLTLDAAQSSRLNPRFSRPLDHNQIKKLLDSHSDRDVLDGLRRVLEMMYRNQQTLSFFSSIVKNVASPNLEIKKLVYIYTVHHAEQDPDVALLSINTIQKSLSDSNPQVRALALKTMSGIRVPVISQIVTLAIKKGVADMSPFVRRAAALAIPKCYRLNPSQLPSLLEYMSTLLADKYYVAGAAVMAFLEICPERIDLIHKHYRSLVRKIIDMDDWSQIATIRMLTFYARKCFPRRTRRVQRKGAKTSSYTTSPNDLQDFYGEPDYGETTPSQDGDTEEVILDKDLELLLSSITPLLHSRSSGVILAVTRCFVDIGTSEHLIQQDPESHTNTVIRLAKNLDSATEPQARATIIWLVGEFSGLGGEDNIAPDVLRILLKSFATESEDAKRQIVLLAAKVYLHYINSKNDMQKEPLSSLTTRNDTDSEDDHPIAQLWRYVAALVRYDTSYDLRDRARMCRSLIGVPQLATLLLLAPKPAPQAPSPSDSRKGLRLGSSTLVLGGVGGIHGIRGYEAMPDWVSDGAEPSPSLRDSEETSSVPSAMAYSADTEKRVLTAAERLSEASRSTSLGVPLNKMAGSEPGAFSNGGERGSASGTGEKSLDDWLAESESEEEDEDEDEDEDEESDDEESEEDDDDEDDDDDDGEDEESSDADSENARLMH